jgi:hypothetical protein
MAVCIMSSLNAHVESLELTSMASQGRRWSDAFTTKGLASSVRWPGAVIDTTRLVVTLVPGTGEGSAGH